MVEIAFSIWLMGMGIGMPAILVATAVLIYRDR